jgi:two-component system, LytTR family, response regulator
LPDSRWRVLIADDEPAARRGVRYLIERFEDFRIAGECRNGEEVLDALDAAEPHVVFLDIQMPGTDAFAVIAQRTPERMPLIVFLTAYDEYAIRAFEVHAVDYLVKPVSEVRFAITMERLTRQLESFPARPAGFVVSTASGVTVLPLREIDWIEAADTYARLWIGRRSYLIRQSLRDLERRLHPHGFARAHRRALVCVERIRTVTQSSAVLFSGAEIEVSRRQRRALLAALRGERASRPQ